MKGFNKLTLVGLLCLGISANFSWATPTSTASLLNDEKNTIAIFKRASPYVVFIHNLQRVIDLYFDIYEIQTGAGSGFIWDAAGHIVTNYHVIANANDIVVTLGDNKTVKAKLIGADPRKDIAILKLSTTQDLPKVNRPHPLPIANLAQLQVGQKVLAIGNPFGLDRTLTTGVISALGRRVPGIGGVSITDMIQTDASINPGNSGGPLLDSQGQLIGMNTAIYSQSGTSAGIGFAVPASIIQRVADQIIKDGHVTQSGIGVEILDGSIAQQFKMSGAIIASVVRNSPAEKAGLRGTTRGNLGELNLGDLIIHINDQKIRDYDDLYNFLSKTAIGEKLTIDFIRSGQQQTTTLTTIDISKY